MATTVIMPKQGQSVETCLIVSWKKRPGDPVKIGDVICEVETDKATFEVESPAEGTLLAIFHEAGSDVPVLAPIAAIGKPGEKVEGPAATASAAPAAPAPTAAAPAAIPATARAAAEAPAAPGGKILASPRAKAFAAARGVSLAGIRGTGPGGRIIERDVAAAAVSRPAPAPAAGRGVTEIRVTGVRKLIAERMLASLATTAQLTLNSLADARSLQDLRRKFKESPEEHGLRDVTINDMVLFAVSRALGEHRDLNAHFLGDTIRQFDDVHLAFAIDTPRGLMVPVIRGAHGFGLRALAKEAARLVAACREGGITLDELTGGTFTVTNLGGMGIESFTPILNPPQVAILGVGSIALRPVPAAGGGADFVPHIGLSLTINHQAVDGAPGARFLQTLADCLSQFDLLLAR